MANRRDLVSQCLFLSLRDRVSLRLRHASNSSIRLRFSMTSGRSLRLNDRPHSNTRNPRRNGRLPPRSKGLQRRDTLQHLSGRQRRSISNNSGPRRSSILKHHRSSIARSRPKNLKRKSPNNR